MDTKKTLRYNWEFGRETVAIRVSSYRNNGNLYVGLCHKEGREWEDFGDVTINLPYQFLEPNEAFITGDFTKDMLHFIKEHKLGKVLNETGRSGYATYQKVAFDLARLAEFDPEGVAEHCRFAGIEVPKEKPQKTKKQSRGYKGSIPYKMKRRCVHIMRILQGLNERGKRHILCAKIKQIKLRKHYVWTNCPDKKKQKR